MKKALVVGSGGLNGAYSAGVVAELGRQLGPKHFDAVYASSVGVYAATFLVANQPDLTVPHPRFRERRFVLEPLAEIAPELTDPVTGQTVAELLIRLEPRDPATPRR